MKIIDWIKQNKILLLIVLVGALLRFYKIDNQSIWLDEICSFIESNPNKGVSEIYSFVKEFDPHPPFYYISLSFIFKIFGYTTLVMRTYSAVLGILGVVAIYFLAKELLNSKRAGLIAATLTSLNHFHIYYSQEGRMYALLFLTTILSFYFLIKFLKKPKLKTALLQAVFATLMIYSHFFGLFVLIAQYSILLYFLIIFPKEERKKLFLLSALSGIITFILWIPALKILLVVAKIQSIWIQPPTDEFFGMLFKSFFGNSELLTYIISLLLLFCFFKFFDENDKAVENDKVKSSNNFIFVVLLLWIFVSLLIPYIRTFTSLPMMIDRYFISILPAVFLLITIGFIKIKNNLVQGAIISIFIIGSLVNTILVKDYYNKVTKTQFREITEKIVEKNNSNTIVISTWAWHLQMFLNKDKGKTAIKENTLQGHIDEMMADPTKEKDFWFMAAHFQNYQLSPEATSYLENKFNVVEKLEYFDTWANKYVLKSNSGSSDNFNLSSFESINLDEKGQLYLFENSNIKTDFFELEKGNYEITVNANSIPEVPINGENGHIKIRINGDEIANYFLSENIKTPEKKINFENTSKRSIRVQIIYDNDVFENGKDRNIVIYSISLKKK